MIDYLKEKKSVVTAAEFRVAYKGLDPDTLQVRHLFVHIFIYI